VTATSADNTKAANMSTDTNFFDSKLQPRRAALFDCVGEIFQKLDEWEEKVDLGRPSKGAEHIALWAAVHALEKLHRQASRPDITRWLASWTIAQLLAEIYTATDSLDSDEEFSPRLAALRGCIVNINLKLKEWDDKINLGGPSKGGEYTALSAAVHGLEQLHRQVSGPDITRWFVLWVKNQVMAEIYTID
jgi:hypothetical protein